MFFSKYKVGGKRGHSLFNGNNFYLPEITKNNVRNRGLRRHVLAFFLRGDEDPSYFNSTLKATC
jgi:hypothetical protein